MVDKNGNGIISRKDAYRLMRKYNDTVRDNVNVRGIIRQCDTNRDGILDQDEVHELLSVPSQPSKLKLESAFLAGDNQTTDHRLMRSTRSSRAGMRSPSRTRCG